MTKQPKTCFFCPNPVTNQQKLILVPEKAGSYYTCKFTIDKQKFTSLEISSYYEKHNQEYLEALEKRGIKLSKAELAEKLITDKMIIKTLLSQLEKEEEIRADGYAYQYTYYFAILYKEVKAYKLIWCTDENKPQTLGIMDCFRVRKYDKTFNN